MQVISENFAVARSVKVKYPKINKPYKFDDKENRTLPCGAKEQNAEYLMEFEMTSLIIAEVEFDHPSASEEEEIRAYSILQNIHCNYSKTSLNKSLWI